MVGEDLSARELARRLEETLARFGIAGSIAIATDMATLHGNGPTVSAELGTLVGDWATLAEDARARRVMEVARRLSSERRAVAALDSSRRRGIPSWARPAVAGVAAVAAALVGARYYELHAAGEAKLARTAATRTDPDQVERVARAARVCQATRSRVMRGASIGPSDAEGWVVELWVLRPPDQPEVTTDPALGELVRAGTGTDRGRVVWKGAPSLTAIDSEGSSVAVTDAALPSSGPPVYRGARVTLSGRFAPLYFDETTRRDYHRFARAVADAIGARYAALYARCDGNDAHHIGSWFRGPSPGGAVTSLLFFMGAFGEHPELRAPLLVEPVSGKMDAGYAFQNVSNVAGALKKARVMTMLGPELGMIAGVDGQSSIITFPFRDANRASRATLTIARELGIDDAR